MKKSMILHMMKDGLSKLKLQIQKYFKRINQMKLKSPLLVGFGISNKETRRVASINSNGVIIGSDNFVKLEKVNNLLIILEDMVGNKKEFSRRKHLIMRKP